MSGFNEKIILLGAGNLGFHLGKRLFDTGQQVLQVYSRTQSKALSLANLIQAESCTHLSKIRTDGTLYILAVSDKAIHPVAQSLKAILPPTALIVHTSGATSSQVLGQHFKNHGILYPLQTFSYNRPLDFNIVPVCISANSDKSLSLIKTLGNKISQKVYTINDDERANLHLAAVFVNNFTNFLFGIGHDITRQAGLPFDILQPLMEETLAKVQEAKPMDMQTGPARRGDEPTIKRHLELLEAFPAYSSLYQQLTEGIQKWISEKNKSKE